MISLRPMSSKHSNALIKWFKDDSEGYKRLDLYAKPKKWLNLINKTTRFGWIAFKNGIPVGFLDLEYTPENMGSIAFYIAPEFRGQDYCRLLIKALCNTPETKKLKQLIAYVEEDNMRSINCLTSLGFKMKGKDKDNLLKLKKKL